MPKLKPETISMTGLNLFQHLCNLARLATSAYDSGPNCEVRERSAHTHTHTHTHTGRTDTQMTTRLCVCAVSNPPHKGLHAGISTGSYSQLWTLALPLSLSLSLPLLFSPLLSLCFSL